MKQLAIMGEPHFGLRDMSHPAFWFDVSFGEDLGYGSLIIVNSDTFTKAVEEAAIYDIKKLEGAPCQIDVSDDNIVKFVKFLKK